MFGRSSALLGTMCYSGRRRFVSGGPVVLSLVGAVGLFVSPRSRWPLLYIRCGGRQHIPGQLKGFGSDQSPDGEVLST